MLERETGIEPASLAWKAKVLPLNYSRLEEPTSISEFCFAWWRRLDSNQRRRKPTDLQSAPFSHSGTPPRRTAEFSTGTGLAGPAQALQSIGARCGSARDRNSIDARKWPQPMKGLAPRRADNGDG